MPISITLSNDGQRIRERESTGWVCRCTGNRSPDFKLILLFLNIYLIRRSTPRQSIGSAWLRGWEATDLSCQWLLIYYNVFWSKSNPKIVS